MNPTLYMLIGVPGSGKTTWIKNRSDDGAVILSTDDYVEQAAQKHGKTYSEVFSDVIDWANSMMSKDLDYAIKHKMNIVWDQTNLTAKSRKGKLRKVPDDYKRVAVFFGVPADLRQRLSSRPGKTIPDPVVLSMINQLQPPTKEEGFDEIVYAS